MSRDCLRQRSFQSTLSMRRATSVESVDAAIVEQFQSTLSMRRATSFGNLSHACETFQSTLSMRRATVQLDIFVRFLRRKPAA